MANSKRKQTKPKSTPPKRSPNKGQKRKRDTQVRAPVAVAKRSRTRAPVMRRSGNSLIVTHSEYVKDIFPFDPPGETLGFEVPLQEPVSPANPKLFPWLSTIAGAYEFGKFTKLDLEYRTDCSTSAIGSVMTAIDFDAADSAPSSKAAMSTIMGCARGPAWAPNRFHSSSMQLAGFIGRRPTVPDDGGDPRISYLGTALLAHTVQSGAEGMPPGQPFGEVWVHYTVELSVPQPPEIQAETYGTTICWVQLDGSISPYDPSNVGFDSAWTQGSRDQNILILGVSEQEEPAVAQIAFGPGYQQLSVDLGSEAAEIESDQVSVFQVSTEAGHQVITILHEAGVSSWRLSYFNASDTTLDDAPQAGTECWIIYVPPLATGTPIDLLDLFGAPAQWSDNEVSCGRLRIYPVNPRSIVAAMPNFIISNGGWVLPTETYLPPSMPAPRSSLMHFRQSRPKKRKVIPCSSRSRRMTMKDVHQPTPVCPPSPDRLPALQEFRPISEVEELRRKIEELTLKLESGSHPKE